MATAVSTCPPLMYPEKFELALQYGEKVLLEKPELSDSDKILLYALSKQAEKGPCPGSGKHKEERPSMWDTVARAKWNAWLELGNRSKMEAMFMYVTAVEEVRSTRLRFVLFFSLLAAVSHSRVSRRSSRPIGGLGRRSASSRRTTKSRMRSSSMPRTPCRHRRRQPLQHRPPWCRRSPPSPRLRHL